MTESIRVSIPDVLVEDPDPRFEEFPVPDTVDEVVARIVSFVQIAVRDAGGPSYEFNRNEAEAIFKEEWGEAIEKHLDHGKKIGQNPWLREWKAVVHVAKIHARKAVDRAKKRGRKPVSGDDFKLAGCEAAGSCWSTFGRTSIRGCWCNIC